MGEKTLFNVPSKDVPLRSKRCETCAAFADAVPGRMPSTCRKGLPNLIMSQQGVGATWIPVMPEDWCLQWEAKPIDIN